MNSANLANLDLNLLVVLDRVLSTGSVTEAARSLGITQPAMSRSLQRLREMFGDPLFVRAGRGLTPTPRALALVEPLSVALQAVQRVVAPPEVFDPSTATGTVVIAMGDETQLGFADLLLAAIWEQAPGLDVRVRALSEATINEGRSGLVDIAITPDLSPLPASAGTVDLSEFIRRPLYTRRFVVAASAVAPRPALSVEDYVAAEHVIVSFEAGGWGFVDDLLAARGLRRRVAASVTSFHAAARVVARTRLLVTLPEEVVRTAPVALTCYPPPLPIPELPMLLVWHPRTHHSPRHRFVRERIAAVIQQQHVHTGA